MQLQDIHLRDPFVLPDGGKYYMYGTAKVTRKDNATVMTVYVSDDLFDWQPIETVLKIPGGFWGTQDYWAPDVFLYRDRYYMLITLGAPGRKRGTQILVADSPTGDFTPLTDGPITPPDRQCLDATLYFENGTPYLVYSWEWLETGSGKLVLVQLSDDLTHTVGGESILLSAAESGISACLQGEYEGKTVNGYVTDAPLVYKTESGKYLLMWSTFSQSGYSIAIAESDTLRGVYRHREVLFDRDGGHAMLFKDYFGTHYISFHSPNDDVERPTFLPIEETDNMLRLTA